MKWIIALIEKNKLGKIVRVLFVDELQTKLSTNDKYVFTKNTGPGFNKLKTQVLMNINSYKYHAMYFFTSDLRWLTKPNIGLNVSHIVKKKGLPGLI